MVLKSFSGNRPVRHTSSVNSRFARLWLLQVGQGSSQGCNQHTKAGFTLIDALVAIVIVSIVMVAITPPIFMATASRIQQRKAQQALQLAQGEVDRVRTIVERGTYTLTDLPSVVTDLNSAAVASAYHATTKSVNTTTYDGSQVDSTKFLPVDVSGDGNSDFLVQSFRAKGPDETTTNPPTGFRMGVRVYADTPTLRANIGALSKERASLQFTTGLGQQARQPLAVLYSTIVRSDTSKALKEYQKLCPDKGC